MCKIIERAVYKQMVLCIDQYVNVNVMNAGGWTDGRMQ